MSDEENATQGLSDKERSLLAINRGTQLGEVLGHLGDMSVLLPFEPEEKADVKRKLADVLRGSPSGSSLQAMVEIMLSFAEGLTTSKFKDFPENQGYALVSIAQELNLIKANLILALTTPKVGDGDVHTGETVERARA